MKKTIATIALMLIAMSAMVMGAASPYPAHVQKYMSGSIVADTTTEQTTYSTAKVLDTTPAGSRSAEYWDLYRQSFFQPIRGQEAIKAYHTALATFK